MNLTRFLLPLVAVVPGCGPSVTRSSNQPDFGEVVRADVAPPPISGGTLHVTGDGRTAIASDPDRDAIFVVDLETEIVRAIALPAGDEPGRVAVDDEGRAHVALRRGGLDRHLDGSDLRDGEIVTRGVRRKRAGPLARACKRLPGSRLSFLVLLLSSS